MIHRAVLTAELKRLVLRIEDDLRARSAAVPDIEAIIAAEWEQARTANRTRLDAGPWRESLLTQVAVGWVLGSVFVRFCEDNGLLPTPLLSGPGERLKQAVDGQTLFFRAHAADGERAFLADVFERVSRLPGLAQVFGAHNPYRLFGPSDDGARAILDYWRDIDPETGALRRPLIEPGWDTRFLGDVYQDLSESAKKQFALLQTPDFVEKFILDRTLEPALDEFGLDGFRMIDPACGSGHFLLGSFARLFERWLTRAPHEGTRAAAERALQSVHGVDLNPFAVAIARFRLLVAAMKAAGVPTLAEAPNFTLQVATGDSLLHGPPPGQQVLRVEEADPATRHLFATEDGVEVKRILGQHYHAVVANPPYITPKDPAANDAYRRRYKTCHRQYSLAVPFMERLFDLAERGAEGRAAGFVGQITANSFMKREFGKPLIEQFLAKDVDLTHVIDTSGAYIPGHGTPTVILFGRNQRPVGSTVRAVMGIRGEPSRPDDPANGVVWTAILRATDNPGCQTEHISCTDLARPSLSRHPWSLQGGGAEQLLAAIAAQPKTLRSLDADIGALLVTRMDDAYERPPQAKTLDVGLRPYLKGDDVRDWSARPRSHLIHPYSADFSPSATDTQLRLLWPSKTTMRNRTAYGETQIERGLTWFEYSMAFTRRWTGPAIHWSHVATHNHFALVRSFVVSNHHAQVIKLPAGASEAEHLALLGLLNSSTACFWMKQVFHNKGVGGGARVTAGYAITGENFENHYEFDGTKLKQFPVPGGSAETFSTVLAGLARALAGSLPGAVTGRSVPTRMLLDECAVTVAGLRRRMVSVQEELDWRCYSLYGLTTEDLSLDPDDAPSLDKGERVFEIALARGMAAGEAESSWFIRHGSIPITELPEHWPAGYRAVVERRLALIESDPHINLIERPEYKRRWYWESWESLEHKALRGWLLDRLEAPHLWSHPQLWSVARLADQLAVDADFVQVASLYRKRPDVDLGELVAELVRDQAVPYLSAWRYTEPGLRTRAVWEQTWVLQRSEDAGEDVGTIPVPPRYGTGDFASKAIWSLRGKLDVPKERFVSYPGLSRDSDPSLLVGWAGWDHLQQATALAAWYEERRTFDGWDAEQLSPILAGLAELVPWLRQWHNELDPASGQRLGDFFAEFVTTECHTLGLTAADLLSWKPPASTRGRRRKAAI